MEQKQAPETTSPHSWETSFRGPKMVCKSGPLFGAPKKRPPCRNPSIPVVSVDTEPPFAEGARIDTTSRRHRDGKEGVKSWCKTRFENSHEEIHPGSPLKGEARNGSRLTRGKLVHAGGPNVYAREARRRGRPESYHELDPTHRHTTRSARVLVTPAGTRTRVKPCRYQRTFSSSPSRLLHATRMLIFARWRLISLGLEPRLCPRRVAPPYTWKLHSKSPVADDWFLL